MPLKQDNYSKSITLERNLRMRYTLNKQIFTLNILKQLQLLIKT